LNTIIEEIAKRRTFAIISHPDAGKTTLTEKLLLYSGMVRTAGMVRARKGAKHASSDWMAMEQERGISISASAMQFTYKGAVINVLDTPGHQDFSEDTYRTLHAADSAIMVIDAGKGVEEQTKKLFAVCKMQKIPVVTFINKMDLPPKDLFTLLQEVENVLGIVSAPLNWPIGRGKAFVGLYDFASDNVSLFSHGSNRGSERALMQTYSRSELKNHLLDDSILQEFEDDLELLGGAGTPFNEESFLRGEMTPVFFGSGLSNFGVETLFDNFVRLSPPPRAYEVLNEGGDLRPLSPDSEEFAGFVFKIQSNMNPKHRDSMAYLRVCSGVFNRDMTVLHHRSQKMIRLSRSYTMMASARDTIEAAFPGDIVGFINPGTFTIGDTVSVLGNFHSFKPMPQFPPEIVAEVRPKEVIKRKAFDKGIAQLGAEGAIQLLRRFHNPGGSPLVAAVGKLQFEVLEYRLESEYGVKCEVSYLPYRYGVYLEGEPRTLLLSQGSIMALDKNDRLVVLYSHEWEKRFLEERNKNHRLLNFF
jgi:peptide chain release factor 3